MGRTNTAYESESVVEALDYYPYGAQRIDTKTNYGGVRNKYAATVYDALSGLNYMQAPYQNSSHGQFISEDPVFLGDPKQQNLKDPQSLNSYSYANDNPITKSDPTGKFGAAALAPLALPSELFAGATLPAWAVPALIGTGIIGGGYLLYRSVSPKMALDTNTLHASLGPGYNPDLEPPQWNWDRGIGMVY